MNALARITWIAVSYCWAAPALAADDNSCPGCATWNASQQPFRIYGNTYYVGTQGLSSILITSSTGHVLIDGGLPESAPKIVASIRELGYRIEDVKVILNSHVHYDHAGGIAELQRLSKAQVFASSASARVMQQGIVGRDDPQYGLAAPIATITAVNVVKNAEVLRVGSLALVAHMTPGHTPGGTSWSWQSCEQDDCLNMVYADSLSAVSAEGFRYTGSREYPHALNDFATSFATLSTLACDVLLTPHPDASGLWTKLEQRENKVMPNPFVNQNACKAYADAARAGLAKRVAQENAGQ